MQQQWTEVPRSQQSLCEQADQSLWFRQRLWRQGRRGKRAVSRALRPSRQGWSTPGVCDVISVRVSWKYNSRGSIILVLAVTLYNRRLQDIAILMYKVKNGLLASSGISELFQTKNSGYSLRNSDFNIPRFNTIRYGKHSLRYQGPLIWSKLSAELRGLPSLKAFKAKIRKIDLSSQIDNNTNCCNLCNLWTFYFKLYIA